MPNPQRKHTFGKSKQPSPCLKVCKLEKNPSINSIYMYHNRLITLLPLRRAVTQAVNVSLLLHEIRGGLHLFANRYCTFLQLEPTWAPLTDGRPAERPRSTTLALCRCGSFCCGYCGGNGFLHAVLNARSISAAATARCTARRTEPCAGVSQGC